MATPRPSPVAALAGASGLVGGYVLAELLDRGRHAGVVSVGRQPGRQVHPGLRHVVKLDLTRLTGDLLGGPADEGYCCLGTTIRAAGSRLAFRRIDVEAVASFARAVRDAGATRFALVSSVGASQRTSNFYLRCKADAEAAVSRMGFTSLVILRPALLDGPRMEARRGEQWGLAVLRVLAPALVGPLRRYRVIHARTVARAMVRAVSAAAPGVTILESERIAALGE